MHVYIYWNIILNTFLQRRWRPNSRRKRTQKPQHVVRRRSCDSDVLQRHGMLEHKRVRVQHGSRGREWLGTVLRVLDDAATIQSITEHGAAGRGQMHSNLVCATGADDGLDH